MISDLTVPNRVDSWGYSGSTGPSIPHSLRVDFSLSGVGGGNSSPSSYWNGVGGDGSGDGGGVGSGDGDGGGVGSGDGDGGGDGAGVRASGLNSSPNGLVLSNSSIA